MATRAGFQRLSAKLQNKTFGDFRRDLVLTNAGVYDPITGGVTGGDAQTLKGIRLAYNQSEVDGQNIKQGDFKIILVKQELTIDVRPDSTSAVYDGVPIHIMPTKDDPADAALIFQAREK